MRKTLVIAFAAFAAIAEAAMPVTHREATNIAEKVVGSEVRNASTPIPEAKTNLLTYVRQKAHPTTGEVRGEDEDGSVVIGKDASGTISSNFIGGVTRKTQLRSEAVAIGHNATVTFDGHGETVQGIAIGWNAKANGSNALAIGSGAKHWYETDEGGDRTYASGSEAVAFGYCARATAKGAVQIGKGINTNADTLQFREWPLVGADGKILLVRLPDLDEKYLTTNLIGKTIVSGTNTVIKMGAGTRVEGTDDMYIRLGGGVLRFPENLAITVIGNRTLGMWGITNAYTKEEADAILGGKLGRIVWEAQWPWNFAEFRQSNDGLDFTEWQIEDGETNANWRARFGRTIHATDDADGLTAGIRASEDCLGFGISDSASDFENGSFSIFYGNGFIDIGDNQILIPNATGTMALRSTTLAGYGIGDAYTKAETERKIQELAPVFNLTSQLVYEKIVALGTTSKSALFDSLLAAYGDGLVRNDSEPQTVDGLTLVASESTIGGGGIVWHGSGGTAGGNTLNSVSGDGGSGMPGTGGRTGGRTPIGDQTQLTYIGFGMSTPGGTTVTPGYVYSNASWWFDGVVRFDPECVFICDAGDPGPYPSLPEWVETRIEEALTPAKLIEIVEAMTAAQKSAFKAALGIQ